MRTRIRGLLTLALASTGLAMPTGASAQERINAEEYFGVVHIIPGMPLSMEDNARLKNGETIIYTAFNQDELDAIVAEYGPNSDKVRKYMDSKLSKEGNVFVTAKQTGGNVTRTTRFKGVDMDGNCTVMESFIIANNSSGRPVSTHTTCTGNWQSTFSTAMASAMGQTATNVATIGTSRVFDELLTPPCINGCGPQQVFHVNGGNASAAAANRNENASVMQSAISLCGSTGCGQGGQTPNPPPAHVAPSGNNTAYNPQSGGGG